MTRNAELAPLLKRLKLSAMLDTLPERIALARREQLDYSSLPGDHTDRRDQPQGTVGARNSDCAPPGLRRSAVLRTSTGRRRLPWTAGCWTPCSLYSSCSSTSTSCWWDRQVWARASWPKPWATPPSEAGYTVRFVHADDFFRSMAQARVDNSVDRTFRTFLTPDLLIVDDLGLHRLTGQQSADLYELIINRHRVSSFVITSNRAVEEWLSLFDDPILGNSALDRLANASYQFVIEGTSYRERLSPHRNLLGRREGD